VVCGGRRAAGPQDCDIAGPIGDDDSGKAGVVHHCAEDGEFGGVDEDNSGAGQVSRGGGREFGDAGDAEVGAEAHSGSGELLQNGGGVKRPSAAHVITGVTANDRQRMAGQPVCSAEVGTKCCDLPAGVVGEMESTRPARDYLHLRSVGGTQPRVSGDPAEVRADDRYGCCREPSAGRSPRYV
jgi:hypothetical protein